MQPSPDLERQRFQRFPNGRGAANPACGTVERSKEAIADGVEFPSTKADDLTAYRAVVLIEEFAPAAVPEVCCALGGADDVQKQNRREHTIVFGGGVDTREEPFESIANWVGGAHPPRMVDATKLRECG